jgi:hypothetical protein
MDSSDPSPKQGPSEAAMRALRRLAQLLGRMEARHWAKGGRQQREDQHTDDAQSPGGERTPRPEL